MQEFDNIPKEISGIMLDNDLQNNFQRQVGCVLKVGTEIPGAERGSVGSREESRAIFQLRKLRSEQASLVEP